VRRVLDMEMTAGEVTVLAPEAAAHSAREVGEPFEAFYRGNVDRIHRALCLTLGDANLGREATDEAMARAYARWPRVGVLDNPAAWVYRVGLNWAVSWWRKVRRERPTLADAPHPGVPPPDPAGLAARAALDRLPLTQRSVVVCRVLLELSTTETAAVLTISEGTVKSRLARALAALRTALTEDGD
jgi:DNA-directed RNA polymerase specialized sigma24 family protein